MNDGKNLVSVLHVSHRYKNLNKFTGHDSYGLRSLLSNDSPSVSSHAIIASTIK